MAYTRISSNLDWASGLAARTYRQLLHQSCLSRSPACLFSFFFSEVLQNWAWISFSRIWVPMTVQSREELWIGQSAWKTSRVSRWLNRKFDTSDPACKKPLITRLWSRDFIGCWMISVVTCKIGKNVRSFVMYRCCRLVNSDRLSTNVGAASVRKCNTLSLLHEWEDAISNFRMNSWRASSIGQRSEINSSSSNSNLGSNDDPCSDEFSFSYLSAFWSLRNCRSLDERCCRCCWLLEAILPKQ